jgi:hypothetical protein
MIGNDRDADVTSTGTLIRGAIEDARELLRTEIALARNDLQREVRAWVRTAVVFTVGALALLLAFALLLVSFGIATFPHVWPSLTLGLVLMLAGAILFVWAGRRRPHEAPLNQARARLGDDVHAIRGRLS